MSVIVEYCECPSCWSESKTVTTVGFDPEVGIVCSQGHKFEENPAFFAPKQAADFSGVEPEKPHRLETETAAVASEAPAVVQQSDGEAVASALPSDSTPEPVATGSDEKTPSLAGLTDYSKIPGESGIPNRPSLELAKKIVAAMGVQANESKLLPGRDLLFGLLIPETLADNLAAYAEEQKRPLAEILNEEVITILKNGWWR